MYDTMPEVVSGFKKHNRGGDLIVGGPWKQPNELLTYICQNKEYGTFHTMCVAGDGMVYRGVRESEHDLLPATREVMGSELKDGDKVVAVQGTTLGTPSKVKLCRALSNGTWIGINNGSTYTIEVPE